MKRSSTNLVELLETSAEHFADRRALGTKRAGAWEWITYGELKSRVDACRAALDDLGIGPTDRVAVIANNRVEWAVAAYATYGRRAAYVPMYESQLSEEWEFILRDCGAKMCFCATPVIFDQVMKFKQRLPDLQHVFAFDGAAEDTSFQTLLTRGKAKGASPALLPEPGETAGLLYTSGTTGQPKGVVLSHENICSNVRAIHQLFDLDNQRSLSFLPWAHSFGQVCELHILLSLGCAIAINDEIPNLVTNLPEVKPTVLIAVPRIFNRIYDGVNAQMAGKPWPIRKLFETGIDAATRRNRGETLSMLHRLALSLADRLIFSKIRAKFGGRLERVISGSAALSEEVARFIDALGITVYEGYGLTETSPIVSVNYEGHRKIGSVGKAVPGVRVVIDSSVCEDTRHGEIVVYGPNVMQGYHNRPEENAAVMMEDGGFRTGDLGRFDDDGFLYITGRIKEQYKLENGKYVVPAPLEEHLKLSPYVANVMLYGANKPFNVALVVPEKDALRRWAEKEGLNPEQVLGELASDPSRGGPAGSGKARELLQQELDKYSDAFKSYERPKKLMVTTEDFTTDNGLLTPKLSLKRNKVLERYQPQLDALYE